jgi:hypothetical protein
MSFTPLTQLDVTHLFRVTGTRKNRAVDSGPDCARIYRIDKRIAEMASAGTE